MNRSFGTASRDAARSASDDTLAPAVEAVEFEEFETYVRCPLQHHYRYKLALPREQELDAAFRARWAVMDTLKVVSKGEASPKDAFAAAWERYKLPSEQEDAALMRDAKTVCRRGLAVVAEHAGVVMHASMRKFAM